MILADALHMITGLLAVVAVLAFFGLGYATKMKIGKNRKMGLNFDQTSCPECSRQLPRIRRPENLRQMLWGGWTCPDCGKEFDKWMKEIK